MDKENWHHYIPKLVKSVSKANIVKDGFWTLGAVLLDRGTAFFVILVVSRYLGQEGLGDYGLVLATILMFVNPLSYGLGIAGTRAIAEVFKSSPEKAFRILILLLSLCLFFIVVIGLLLLFQSHWLVEKVLHQSRLEGLFYFSFILLAGELLRKVSQGILSGFRTFQDRFFSSCVLFIGSLLFVPVVVSHFGVLGVIITTGLINLFAFGTGLVLVGKKYWNCLMWKQIRMRTGIAGEIGIFKEYALPAMFASLVAAPVVWYIQTLLVQISGSTKELAIYTASNQIRMLLAFVPAVMSSVLMPRIVKPFEESTLSSKKKQIILVSIGLSLACGIILATIFSFFSFWISHIFGVDFVAYSTVFAVMSWVGCLNGVSLSLGTVIMSRSSMWLGFVVNAIWAGGVLLLSIIYVPSQGVLGISLAMLLSYIFISLLQCFFIAFSKDFRPVNPLKAVL